VSRRDPQADEIREFASGSVANGRKGPVEATGFRPTRTRGQARVVREAIDVDLVDDQPLREEAAVDAGKRTEEPTSVTPLRRPRGNARAAAARAVPPTGLPAEQLDTWLEWVQDDLKRLEERIEYLEAARAQLREQERLLGELLQASGPLDRS
jgi:hypothetical protein